MRFARRAAHRARRRTILPERKSAAQNNIAVLFGSVSRPNPFGFTEQHARFFFFFHKLLPRKTRLTNFYRKFVA